MNARSARHLVLLGGGHAHVAVLHSFARSAETGLDLTLISPRPYAVYSGMVPGVVAGQYPVRAAEIDVAALAARAGAAFLPDRAVRIDAARRLVELAERPPLAYDFLSLDVGSRPRGRTSFAQAPLVVPVKPIELVVDQIETAFAKPAPPGGRHLVVVGAGAGGVELAFALAVRLRREGAGSVTVCDRSARPVTERHARTATLVERSLADHGIRFLPRSEVRGVDEDGVTLADGRRLRATLVIWATGACGPSLLAGSNLPLDERGFLRVGDDLRCREHPEIFAAGDCAALAGHPALPKAGVYAVREGPVLAENLRRAFRGARRLGPYRPQRRFLSLLNTGDGKAILSYGSLAVRGRLAWRLKDSIDRRFVGTYARPPLAELARTPRAMRPCGGCAAKVGADLLGRVLARLEVPPTGHVAVGLAEADDAAVIAQPPGTCAVATLDVFPPFSDDLFLVGRVAAVNAASDLYAMGAEGSAALALVCLPVDDERQAEVRFEQLLRGALCGLERLAIALVGGHTISASETLVGFAMHGHVEPGCVLRKTGARPGDRIVLTKALGTGVVLAAAQAGAADADWVGAAHASMLESNGPAMRILRDHGVRALTDVSGFGLAGHLAEMLRAGGVGARLERRALPFLPGARDLIQAGWRSSSHERNARSESAGGDPGAERSPEAALVHDPQTSGGLLAALPPNTVEAARTAFAEAGLPFHEIGAFRAGPPHWRLE